MAKKRILFISQEIAPYLSSDEASFGRTAAQYMQEHGYEVRIFMPKFGNVNERRNQLHEVIRLSGVNIVISDNDHPLIIKVASLQPSRIQVYFIDNDDYFQKLADDADDAGSNRADNDERAIFYARGTLETAKKLRWDPEVIVCSGWIAALIPTYMKHSYSGDISFQSSKLVYHIVPGKLEAPVDSEIFTKLKADEIPARDLKKYTEMPLDTDTLHKMAIDNSQAVIIRDPEISEDLLEYIKQSGKPFLTAEQAQSGPEAYDEFFKSL